MKFISGHYINKSISWYSKKPLFCLKMLWEIRGEELWFSCFRTINWVEDIPLFIITEKYDGSMPLHKEATPSVIRTFHGERSAILPISIKYSFNIIYFSLFERCHERCSIIKSSNGFIDESECNQLCSISLKYSMMPITEMTHEHIEIFASYERTLPD